MSDTTIIFYTSNREKPEFEKKIVDNLKKSAGKIPIISVSHKPMDLGTNICVGNVGCSEWNIFKQIQLGCEKAKTKFICTAEADCLYPPTGYFDFDPLITDTAYNFMNVWILKMNRWARFQKKNQTLCALFTNREYLLKRLEESIGHSDKWYDGNVTHPNPPTLFYHPWKWPSFTSEFPIINVKTENGLHKTTRVRPEIMLELPYWGKAEDLKKKLL